MPYFPGRIATAAGLALLFAAMLVPLPVINMRWAEVAENCGHSLVFALLAWQTTRWLHATNARGYGGARIIAISLAASTALGALTELTQRLTARDASLGDFGNDLLGACLGTSIAALMYRPTAADKRFTGKRALLAALLVGCAALVAWPLVELATMYARHPAELPVLLDANQSTGTYFTSARRASVAIVADTSNASEGGLRKAIRIRFNEQPYPHFTLDEPTPDWSAYSVLQFELSNVEPIPLHLQVSVHISGDSRNSEGDISHTLAVPPGLHQRLRVSLAVSRSGFPVRPSDLNHVDRLVIFGLDDAAGRELLLHEIRLIR